MFQLTTQIIKEIVDFKYQLNPVYRTGNELAVYKYNRKISQEMPWPIIRETELCGKQLIKEIGLLSIVISYMVVNPSSLYNKMSIIIFLSYIRILNRIAVTQPAIFNVKYILKAGIGSQ